MHLGGKPALLLESWHSLQWVGRTEALTVVTSAQGTFLDPHPKAAFILAQENLLVLLDLCGLGNTLQTLQPYENEDGKGL
jgi:hypothetical protein